MESAKPRGGKCEKHGLQVAPDGLCTLCRRANAPPPQEEERSWTTPALGVIALCVISVAVYMALHQKPAADPFKAHGPPLEAQIAAVDKQIKELKASQRNGDLDQVGLNALSALQNKRVVLSAELAARERNK
jgi:hypothetical protein